MGWVGMSRLERMGMVCDPDWININLSRATPEGRFADSGLKPMGFAGERLCRCGELLHGYQGDFCWEFLVIQRDFGALLDERRAVGVPN